MWNRKSLPIALVSAVSILLSTAGSASGQPSGPPYSSRIGWFHQCLAIQNHKLQPGTPVTIIKFGGEDALIVEGSTHGKRLVGAIAGKTRSPDRCPALQASSNGVNDTEDVSFYEVSLEGAQDTEFTGFGIGIVGLGPEDMDPIDLDGNGAEDSFTTCKTRSSDDAVSFVVWTGEPYEGKPLWMGYYVLFYAYESDCPQ